MLLRHVQALQVDQLQVDALQRRAVLIRRVDRRLPPAAVVNQAVVGHLRRAAVRQLVRHNGRVLRVHIQLLRHVPRGRMNFQGLRVLRVPAVRRLVARHVGHHGRPAAPQAALVNSAPLLRLSKRVVLRRTLTLVINNYNRRAK